MEIFDEEGLVFSKSPLKGETYYARTTSKEAQELEKEILSLYQLQGESLIDLAPSGMSAISSVFHNLAISSLIRANATPRGLIILLDIEVYSDTPHLLEYLQGAYPGMIVRRVDCSNSELLRQALRNETRAFPGSRIVVFSESCSNPTGRIFCFENLQDLKNEFSSLWIVIDNTWTTALGVNPFSFGADVVVESLTKYVSGGRAIGGVTLSSHAPFMADIRKWHQVNGLHVSIENSRQTLKGIRSISSRIHSSGENALAVMKTLVEKGVEVIHPFIGNHPSRQRNEEHSLLKLAPAVFVVKSKFVSKTQLRKRTVGAGLEWKTSYGGPLCRIDPYPVLKEKEGHTLVRVSIGYEDFEPVILVEKLLKVIIR